MRPTRLFYCLFPLLLALDQASKVWAERSLPRYSSIEIIPHVFNLHYVQNRGIAFGLLPGMNYWLAGSTILLIACGLWWASKAQLDWKRRDTNLLAAALLAGAVGNLIDRFHYGYVVDFLSLDPIGYPWIFNIADSCITLSLVWIILHQFLPEKTSPNTPHSF